MTTKSDESIELAALKKDIEEIDAISTHSVDLITQILSDPIASKGVNKASLYILQVFVASIGEVCEQFHVNRDAVFGNDPSGPHGCKDVCLDTLAAIALLKPTVENWKLTDNAAAPAPAPKRPRVEDDFAENTCPFEFEKEN